MPVTEYRLKSDKFHMQSQFTVDETFMFALFSKAHKRNIDVCEISIKDMPRKIVDYINNKVDLSTKDIYRTIASVIAKDGGLGIYDSDDGFGGVETMEVSIPLDEMPPEYQIMYSKLRLLA